MLHRGHFPEGRLLRLLSDQSSPYHKEPKKMFAMQYVRISKYCRRRYICSLTRRHAYHTLSTTFATSRKTVDHIFSIPVFSPLYL